MSAQPSATIGRSRYDGFRATIKAVGTGRRGSRDLEFEEAREATRALLAGEVSDAQAGAFLVAMRIKGEAPAELAGIAQALRDVVETPAPPGDLAVEPTPPLVACAGAYDGTASSPQLGLAAALAAAACGARVVIHCGDRLGPKHGVTCAEVLEALGGPARPSLDTSAAMLERVGVALVHAGVALPGWSRLAALRDEIGLRGPLHTAEKLVDYLGATRFVIGHTHGSYSDRILGALRLLGAERAIAVRGIEGSDVLRPGRPAAYQAGGQLELPERLGMTIEGASGAAESAALTRAVLGGEEDGPLAYTVALSAGVRLYAADVCDDVMAGAELAAAALRDGRATATLEALVR